MDDMDKTIPPQHRPAENIPENGGPEYVTEKTIPGRLERKPTGRYAVGDLILHRYKVLAELGQGGMGVVYKCFDETAGIEVALKALPPELSHNSLEMEDVKDNFQLVSKLIHQNIAASKTLERDPATGDYYLIMECIDGEDLRRWIKRKRKEGTLTPEAVLPVLRQVADALDYAHAERVIHRDIKPGNIMINAAGKVKVLDFGLAAQIHTSMTRVSMAYHGTSGTGPYMAPEQWRGRAQGAAADQYALAVMAYEMLAGHLPFESTDAAVLREAVLNDTPQELDNIPIYARNAIRRAMSKEPENRFASCADFVAAFSGKKFKASKASKSSRTVGIVVVLVLILALAGGGIVWHRVSGERAEAEQHRAEATRQAKLEAERKQQAERQRLTEAQNVRELAAKKQAENDTLRQEIYLLQSRAERRQKIIESTGYDRGQTFGKHLDECAEFTFAGVRAVENNDFASAKKYFESANASAEWIEKNAPLREQCKDLQRQINSEKSIAEKLEGEKLAKVSYDAAVKALTNAVASYESGKFAVALNDYGRAKSGFVQAVSEAKTEKIAILLSSARSAKQGRNWSNVKAIADEVLKIDASNPDAKALVNEAAPYIKAETITRLLVEANAAKLAKKWQQVEQITNTILELDSTNREARELANEAKRANNTEKIDIPSQASTQKDEPPFNMSYGKKLLNEENYTQALNYFEKYAEKGNRDALFYLGHMYLKGIGTIKDEIKGFRYSQEAARQGHALALYNTALCYQAGYGISQDIDMAMKYYLEAEQRGCIEAMIELGNRYREGRAVKQDIDKAMDHYRQAASRNNDQAKLYLIICAIQKGNNTSKYVKELMDYSKEGNSLANLLLGICYANGYGVTRDYRKAVAYYQKSAKAGNIDAINNLAICYYNGSGVEKNSENAVKLLQLSAQLNNEIGCSYLALCYRYGRGVRPDMGKCLQLNIIAANQKNIQSARELGEIYCHGLAGSADLLKSAYFYKIGAEAGDASSQYELGLAYDKGSGVTQDYAEAFRWYSLAAEQGNSSAQNNLGTFYHNGTGDIKKDYKMARYWYEKAANQGHLLAQKNLSKLP